MRASPHPRAFLGVGAVDEQKAGVGPVVSELLTRTAPPRSAASASMRTSRTRRSSPDFGVSTSHLARGERAPDVELVSFEIHVAYFERANLARSKTRVGGECNRLTSASGASGSSLPTFGSLGIVRRKECKGAVSGEVAKACETGVRGPAAAPGRVPSVTRSVRPPRRISFGAAVVQAPRARPGRRRARARRKTP